MLIKTLYTMHINFAVPLGFPLVKADTVSKVFLVSI